MNSDWFIRTLQDGAVQGFLICLAIFSLVVFVLGMARNEMYLRHELDMKKIELGMSQYHLEMEKMKVFNR